MSNLRSFIIETFHFPRFVPKNSEHFHILSINYNRNTSFRFGNETFFLENQTFCLFRKFLNQTSFFRFAFKLLLLELNYFFCLRIVWIEPLRFVSLSNFNPDRTFFRFRHFFYRTTSFCFAFDKLWNKSKPSMDADVFVYNHKHEHKRTWTC